MKTLVLSMISIAATVAAMTACTSESDEIDDLTKDAPVEIKVSAGVGSIITKASMEKWEAAGSKAFFCKAKDHATAADWTTATPIYAKIAEDGSITFYSDENRTTESKQYYNADATIKSWMIGCYLGDAVITGGTNLTNNKATFTITGQQDIMATAPSSGTKKTDENFSEFTFNHLLSNLSFQITPTNASEIEAVKAAFGDVTKIEVSEQPNSLDLTLGETVTLEKNATSGSETFNLTKNVTIGTNTAYGDIMVFPNSNIGTTASPIKIKVYTEKATNGIDVNVKIGDGSLGLVAKTKYLVTLSFSTTDIQATAKIGKWESGSGSGEVK